MGFEKKKKVAVFVCDIMAEYQTQLISHLTDEISKLGYYSLVYSWLGGYGNTEEFDAGERNAAFLPDYEDYDGIFLCLDTFTDDESQELVLENVKRYSRCPVISLRVEAGDYPAVIIDDDNSMESITRHLIEEHGFKDLFFVGGIKDHPAAISRLACFRRVLAEYGMTLDDEDLYHGDFWRNSGDQIVDEMLERRKNSKLPDAIVCANDYMAIAVCHSLQSRGYQIPDDVVVTGFDDISEVSYTIPSITSVRVDTVELAKLAVLKFKRITEGTDEDRLTYVKTAVIPRQSCGCRKSTLKELTDALRNYYGAWHRQREEYLRSCFMSLDSGIASDMEELNTAIEKYMGNNDYYKDFFVALNDYSWETIDNSRMKGYTKNMRLRTVIFNTELKKNINQRFSRREILPDAYISEEPKAYYIIPLHYQKASYGYAVIDYYPGGIMGNFFEAVIISLCNSLSHLRSSKRNNALIDKLSSLYVTDLLTDLKNRHGFDRELHKMYGLVQSEGRTMAIISLDMDGLKTINDNFGHAEGDFALCIIADAIREASFTDEMGFRVGGDEFQVLCLDYSENSVEKFLRRFNEYLDNFNSTSKKPYNIQASYGHVICNQGRGTTLTEWLTKSDDRMYMMKEKNRETRKIIKRRSKADNQK